jgi:hypothetical protein
MVYRVRDSSLRFVGGSLPFDSCSLPFAIFAVHEVSDYKFIKVVVTVWGLKSSCTK